MTKGNSLRNSGAAYSLENSELIRPVHKTSEGSSLYRTEHIQGIYHQGINMLLGRNAVTSPKPFSKYKKRALAILCQSTVYPVTDSFKTFDLRHYSLPQQCSTIACAYLHRSVIHQPVTGVNATRLVYETIGTECSIYRVRVHPPHPSLWK